MQNIQLYNENCLDIIKELPEKSIDLIVTDPPYYISSRGNAGNAGGMWQLKKNMSGKIFNTIPHITEYISSFYRILKEGGHLYLMTNHKNLQEFLNETTNSGFKFTKSLIWDKGNKIMGQYYMSQFEYILFFRKGKGIKINDCGISDLISIPNVKLKENNKNLHDTEKPVSLMEILIKNSSKENEIILDPFMGIGASGVAALKNNRKFIGVEIEQNYYEIAKTRIKSVVKQEDINTNQLSLF